MIDEKYIKHDEETTFIDTPQELIDLTVRRVNDILKDEFPDYLSFGNGSFTISRGSTQVMIVVRPFTSDETCVECMANVVTETEITTELMRFLLRKNAELHFGSFGLLFDDTITFSHSIAGTNLDANELITTLNSVAVIADYYDDIIVDLSGGKRAADVIDDLDQN
jgi:hypothetical protein